MRTEAEYKRLAERSALSGDDGLAEAYLALMDCARCERERRIADCTRELETYLAPEDMP